MPQRGSNNAGVDRGVLGAAAVRVRSDALPSPSAGPGIEVLSELTATHDVTTVGGSMSDQEAQAILAGS